jgi:hypothetical protein
MTTSRKAGLKTYAGVNASGAPPSWLPPIPNSAIASSPAAPRHDRGRPVWRRTRHAQGLKALLAGVALSALLTPAYALAAERDGTVLFFSFEDLKQMLSHPSLPSLWQLPSSFAWRERPEAAEQDGPLERNIRWGNGQGIDGSTRPGTRPLWGY